MRKRMTRISAAFLAAAVMITACPQYAFADYIKGKNIVEEQINPGPGGWTTTQGWVSSGTVKATSKAVNHFFPSGYAKAVDKKVREHSNYFKHQGPRRHAVSHQNKLNKALAKTQTKEYKISKYNARVAGVVDKGVSAYSIYKTGESYLESRHNHSSLRFTSRVIKGIDIGLNTADIAGAKGAGIAAIGSGYTKDIFESEQFTNWANEQDNAVLDFFDDQVDLIDDYWTQTFYNWWFRPANGVGVYKPNIYLYPAEVTDIRVAFAVPGLLTKVIPDYSGEWNVLADPNGKLVDANGNAYDYLFYESDIQPQIIDLKSAYLIPGNGRKEAFTDILKAYGLNDKEIKDFCEFWDEKLDKDKTYLAYEIMTDDVDRLMPINVDPKPDNILRLWFFFREYSGQDYVKAAPEKLNRNGYTLVEWGGIIE